MMPRLLACALLLCIMLGSCAAEAADIAPAAPANAVSTTNAPTQIWLTFGLDRVAPLRYAPFADIPLWQYLASLLYIVLAFVLSKLVDYLIRQRARNWAKRTSTMFDDVLLELVGGPIKVITFVVLLHLGMRVYQWPEFLESFFSNALKIIVACSITYVLFRAVDVLVRMWHQRAGADHSQFAKELLPLISKSLKVFVVIVAVLVTAQNIGLNVTGLIASLSIGGLALGLAAQDTLGNLFGAIAVLVDKPFRVGQMITLNNTTGMVEAIGFRSTRVRNLDGHLVTIPNKEVGNATITNITERPNIRTVMNFGIVYGTTPEKVIDATKILETCFREHGKTQDVWISFNKFGDFALNIQVIHWWAGTDYKAYLAGMQEINVEIKRRFDAAGIGFAFPTQTLYLKPDAEPAGWTPPARDGAPAASAAAA